MDVAEQEPLLGTDASKGPRRSLQCSVLPWIVALVLLNSGLLRSQSIILFPYLRTLQHCGSEDDSDVRAVEWSGSLHCNDRSRVVHGAQVQTTAVMGAGMLVHSVALPLLGTLGDTRGRRLLLVLDFAGFLASSLLNAFIPTFAALSVSVGLQVATSGLSPAVAGMIADHARSEDRPFIYSVCLMATVGVSGGLYIVLTSAVLARHLHNYSMVWMGMTGVSALGLLLALLTPETLHSCQADADTEGGGCSSGDREGGDGEGDDREGDDREGGEREGGEREGGVGLSGSREGGGGAAPVRAGLLAAGGRRGHGEPQKEWLPAPPPKPHARARLCLPLQLGAICGCCSGRPSVVNRNSRHGSGEDASPFAPCSGPVFRFLLTLVVPLVFSATSLALLDGWALLAFSRWEQETTSYVRLIVIPSSVVALLSSVPLQSLIGTLNTIRLGVLALAAGLGLMCVAHLDLHLVGDPYEARLQQDSKSQQDPFPAEPPHLRCYCSS